MYTMTEKDIRRFQDSCYFDDEGILRWGGSIKTTGYGQFGLGGQMVSAHRVAYFLWGESELRESDHVLHDNRVSGRANRDVIDVRFLYLGDNAQNQRDKAIVGSSKGENHAMHKLKDAQVLELYRRAWAGESQKALALEFGISANYVSCIKHGFDRAYLTGHTREAMAAD